MHTSGRIFFFNFAVLNEEKKKLHTKKVIRESMRKRKKMVLPKFD